MPEDRAGFLLDQEFPVVINRDINRRIFSPRQALDSRGALGWFLIVSSFLICGFWEPLQVRAAVPEIGKPRVGWNRNYVVGRWTPVVVPVTTTEELSTHLELIATDPDGNRVSYLSSPVKLAVGQSELTGLIKVGRLDGDVQIRVAPTVTLRGSAGRVDWLPLPIVPSTRLIVTVGAPLGFDFEQSAMPTDKVVKVAAMSATDLSANSLAYDGVSSLVIAGVNSINDDQSNAIREWVAAGGRLVISLPQDIALAGRSLEQFPDWLPVHIADRPVTVREFGGLESFSGKIVRMPHAASLEIPSIRGDSGVVLAASRSDAFLVRAPYGMGSVTLLAMDLTRPPLSEWKGLNSFCARLTDVTTKMDSTEKGSRKSAQLTSTGITDLATQIHATQEHFEGVQRASPWLVMTLLLLLLLVVGPLDYFIVHRVLRRPHLTWITFPAFVVVSAAIAASLANAGNGATHRANQLNIINVDAETGMAHGRHFITLYSPVTARSSIRVDPRPLVAAPKIKPTSRVSWQGVPEPTFGGMLRQTGLEQGRSSYQQQPAGELTDLPELQWSSKALVADTKQSIDGLVTSDLRASPSGRLTGTLTHRFAAPIEEWVLVHLNRVYRQLNKRDDLLSLPLPPGQIWRVEQPNVYQRELRPYFTGIITVATPRFGESNAIDMIHRQTTYDPLSLDPMDAVRIMTFHDEIGGERYTGLTNQTLDTEDFSQLIQLGRAILFGRLKQTVTDVNYEGKPLEPDRQTTFVRLILPVVRSNEVVRELPRVVPDK